MELVHSFPSAIKPERISFSFRASATNVSGGFFAADDLAFYASASGRMGINNLDGGFSGKSYSAKKWYRVSLLFNWAQFRVSCLVDGQLIITNQPMPIRSIKSLYLYNFDNTQTFWDDIEVIPDSGLPIRPTATSSFSDIGRAQ